MKKKNKYQPLIILLAVLVLIIGVKTIKESLFFVGRERINLVFHGNNTNFFSLNNKNGLHYAISFYPDLQLPVPGGYDYYRVGALGKLANLEKKPDILKRTFSLATSTFVDFYFLPKLSDIYYGNQAVGSLQKPSLKDIFFNQSNANLIDRIYIYFLFFGLRTQDFTLISDIPTIKKGNDSVISLDDFSSAYQGYFYQKIFREEKKNIQIVYNNDIKAANTIGRILEGSGIRVADIAQRHDGQKKCLVKESIAKHSETALEISKVFSCNISSDNTNVYDIIFVLGDKEKDWE